MSPDDGERPVREGEEQDAPSTQLVDVAHLARQTMGDLALQQEVLALFVQQSASVAERIRRANPEERQRLAHGLKGAARGVGAWRLAECLSDLEKRPGDHAIMDRFESLTEETRRFIASMERRS